MISLKSLTLLNMLQGFLKFLLAISHFCDHVLQGFVILLVIVLVFCNHMLHTICIVHV